MPEKAIDPICGMQIDKTEAKATSEYKNRTYYFCAKGCKEQFDRNPQMYSEENKH